MLRVLSTIWLIAVGVILVGSFLLVTVFEAIQGDWTRAIVLAVLLVSWGAFEIVTREE